MEDQLVTFLRTRKERTTGPAVNWEEKKREWIRSVQALYEYVKALLRESIESNDVIVQIVDMVVSEEFVGEYTIPALQLIVGGERVQFLPKGVNVIGASGRVDIRGDLGTVTLLRDRPEVDSGWTVVLQRAPRLTTAPLDSNTLKFALEQVLTPLP